MKDAIVTITLTERDSSAILGVLDNAAENGELNDAFSVTIEHRRHGSEDTPDGLPDGLPDGGPLNISPLPDGLRARIAAESAWLASVKGKK